MAGCYLLLLIIGLYQFDGTNAYLDTLLSTSCQNLDDFECDSGKCIPSSKVCDDQADCVDRTDEMNCDQHLCRGKNYFRCQNNRCIMSAFVCDDENDCGDFSDEKNCTESKIWSNSNCSAGEWMCKDKLCIPEEWVCNGEPDCLDSSDESIGCSAHLECDGFKCDDGACIPVEWHCDGNSDCIDGTDEKSCELIVDAKDCTIDKRKFLCKNNKTCVDIKALCDGSAQCPDKSDESPNCNLTEYSCAEHQCTHDCIQTPTGPLCICPTGYHQISDKHCEDINECEIYGICDQKCTNTPGSYNCFCDSKYKLQNDQKTCKATGGEALMLFTSKTEVRAYFLTSKLYYTVASNLKQVVGVGFDGNHVYWTDMYAESEAIVRADESGSNQELLVTSGLSAPEDLAVDWITGNIYFTDGDLSHIGVCTNDATKCIVLVNEDIHKPRGIVLNPAAGEMYWSDWGKKPEIARAKMDGTEDVSFVSNDIRWPNGLTIDYPTQRLYWVDAKLLTIESILLDGTDRRVILKGIVKHPYAIAVFEDKLYWSDWVTHSIQSCEKFTGKNHHTVIKEKKEYIYGLHIFHSALKQRTNNPCEFSYCSDICLLSGSSYSCACPQDKTLSADNHTCHQTQKKQVLAVGAKDMLILIHHQQLGKQDISAFPVSFKEIKYVTYDSLSGSVIVNDNHKQIYSVNLETKSSKLLVNTDVGKIGGMDFDYYSNNLYWCDTEHKTLEVMSLTTLQRKVIMRDLEAHTPLDLALVPSEGVMFVAFEVSGQRVHIDRIQMDGESGRTHVIEQGLVGPTINLVYDPILQRVFWSDSHTGNIESTSVDGDDRHAFRALITEPASIAVLGKDLFWTNQNSRRIYWADKHNTERSFNKKITLDISKSVNEMYLATVTGVITDKHPCLENNGNCSHICLSSMKFPICTCPVGQILQVDNRTCFAPKHCNSDEFKCELSDVCIKKPLRCDGKKDCLMGEDEDECVKVRRCPVGSFECLNGECINDNKVCDLHYDCRDKSDEMSCNGFERIPTSSCPPDSFVCKNGKCIADRFVCDNVQDCDDGSDELECHSNSCGPEEFRCTSGMCIPKNWECDHEFDCPDQSDEHLLCAPKTCGPDLYTCDNGRCIDKSLLCNSIDDCGDMSDEMACKKEFLEVYQCPEFQFLCNLNETTCVPESSRCNGTSECPGGEDEESCQNCFSTEFECKNKKCISKDWLCDKMDDCGDKSDEDPEICDEKSNVTAYPQMHFQTPCTTGFRCKTGHCIDLKTVCDGVENCYDGSDEHGACETSCEINNNPCSSVCNKTPSGPRCSCFEGYKLKGDSQTCQDINECEETVQPCSQVCANNEGSFVCGCYEGFILRSDRRSCKAIGNPMSIIYSSSNAIRRLTPAINTLDIIYSEDSPRITGLDFSVHTQYLYFSIEQTGTIHRMSLKNKSKDYVNGLGQPQKIAIDWITENVYFIDRRSMSKTIRACHMQEQKCAKVLEITTQGQVSAFVLDAVNKYIFYSTTTWWLFDSPASIIYKCNLDGSKVQEIVKKDLGHVTGLAYDYNKKILYFTDVHYNQIHAVDYDGTNRHVVLSNNYVSNPIGLHLFENNLYFMTSNGQMKKCRIYGQDKICNVLGMHAHNTEVFVVAQESKQLMHENVCLKHNCTHLCIQSHVGIRCLCNNGDSVEESMKCSSDGRSSIDIHETKPEFAISPLALPGKDASKTGSAISGLFIGMLFVVCIVIIYMYIKSKGNSGKFNISMRFRNPTYGMSMPDSFPSTDNLVPGQHEYTNPVHINTQDMQTAANVILQRAKQNPFVMADSATSDTESVENPDSNKLIKL